MSDRRSRFDAELVALKDDLRAMGEEGETMLASALAILATSPNNDSMAVAHRDAVARGEERVNALEEAVEARCLRLLALQQPVLTIDLRLVSAALRVATDAERIGDHAVNVTKVARRLSDEGIAYRPLAPVERMGALASKAVREATMAFWEVDSERARGVIADDDEIDVLYSEARRELLYAMQEDASTVPLASSLLFVTHYLERIGDHAVSIAEQAVYLETGHAPTHRRRSPAPLDMEELAR
jgi:phosphate transport system protein